jgi:trehalose 6-phosphate phosphatase
VTDRVVRRALQPAKVSALSSAVDTGRVRLPRELRVIADRLSRAAVLTDFDGALSLIVDDPARALPVPAAAGALRALARKARTVAIVTGRPSGFLALAHLGVEVIGQYGLELDGRADAVARAAGLLTPLGLPVETKSHMLTVHYRVAPARQAEVEAEAERVAAELGLIALPAKLGVELRPSRAGKGEVVTRLARGAGAVLYAGDDHGDIPAFHALRRLDVPTIAVAVLGKETPPEVVREADVVCPSPVDWVAWLARLAR